MTLTVTRVTHACVLLDFAGQRLLTDPWFSERRGYYRGEPLAFPPAGLPELAGVLVSHGHYDHFDLAAFAAYPEHAAPFVVKRGLAAQIRAAGFANVTEVDPWERADLGGLRVTAAPARHSVPEVSFVIEGGGQAVFFGGNTLRIAELDEVVDSLRRRPGRQLDRHAGPGRYPPGGHQEARTCRRAGLPADVPGGLAQLRLPGRLPGERAVRPGAHDHAARGVRPP
jgi:glyoxylase-like metal-dependent hydrolase (beta-lactamase superfamily II)